MKSSKLSALIVIAGLISSTAFAGLDVEPVQGKEPIQGKVPAQDQYQEQVFDHGQQRFVSCAQLAYKVLDQELGNAQDENQIEYKKIKFKVKKGKKVKCKIK